MIQPMPTEYVTVAFTTMVVFCACLVNLISGQPTSTAALSTTAATITSAPVAGTSPAATTTTATTGAATQPATTSASPPGVTVAPDVASTVCNCTDRISGSATLLACPTLQYIDVILNYTVASDFVGTVQAGWPFLREVCRYPWASPPAGKFNSFVSMSNDFSLKAKNANRPQLCVISSAVTFQLARANKWAVDDQCGVLQGLPAAYVVLSHGLQQPVLQFQASQYLVTLAVMGNQTAVAGVLAALIALSAIPSGERSRSENWLGVAAVFQIPDRTAIDALTFPSNAPNANGLTPGWIALLVCGTVLLFVAGHALLFRNVQASSKDDLSDADDDAARNDDDDGRESAALDNEDEQMRRMEQGWEERDLEQEMNDMMEKKLRMEQQYAAVADEGLEDDDMSPIGPSIVGRRGASRRVVKARASQQAFVEHLHTEQMLALPPETTQDQQSFLEKRRRLREESLAQRRRDEQERAMQERVLTAELPPELLHQEGDDDVAAIDELNELQADATKRGGGQATDEPQPLGLAARRMARMMSSMKFAATPFAASHLFQSQGEVNRLMQGGSVGSHLAMASETGDVLDRIGRTRYSKLYFAPKVLTDQMYHTDDSDDEMNASHRRKLGLMNLDEASSRSQSPQSPLGAAKSTPGAAASNLLTSSARPTQLQAQSGTKAPITSKQLPSASEAPAAPTAKANASPVAPSSPVTSVQQSMPLASSKPRSPAVEVPPAALKQPQKQLSSPSPSPVSAAAPGVTNISPDSQPARSGNPTASPLAPSKLRERARVETVEDNLAVDIDDL